MKNNILINMNKKALYESIMKNVAREVKSALNEYMDWDDDEKPKVKSSVCFIVDNNGKYIYDDTRNYKEYSQLADNDNMNIITFRSFDFPEAYCVVVPGDYYSPDDYDANIGKCGEYEVDDENTIFVDTLSPEQQKEIINNFIMENDKYIRECLENAAEFE